MQLSRDTMNTVLRFPKLNWDSVQDEHKRNTVELRLRNLLSQLPQVTAIEGVKKVDGAKYLIEQAIIETLEKMGRPLDEMALAEMAVEQFLDMELPTE
jgi:hypothetical protein